MCLFTPQLQVSPTRRAFRAMPSAERRRRTPHISRLQLPTNVSSEVAIIVPTHPLHFGKVVDLLRPTKRNVRSMQPFFACAGRVLSGGGCELRDEGGGSDHLHPEPDLK